VDNLDKPLNLVSFQSLAPTGGAFSCHLAGTPMANAKIIYLIADAADRLSERVENEREADAAALLEIIEEELNSARDEIEALRRRVQKLEEGSK